MSHHDVLWEIFSWFDLKKRLEIGFRNDYLSVTALKWCDIHGLLLDYDQMTIISKHLTQIVKYEDREDLKLKLSSLFDFSRAIRSLWIQYELCQDDVALLQPYLQNIRSIYLSSFSFHRNMSLNLDEIQLPNLQSIEILQPVNQNLSTATELKMSHAIKLFPQSISQVVLTGIVLYPAVVKYILLLPHLTVLDIKGVLTDTKNTIDMLREINKSETLVELSLPPSLFCFTDRKSFPDVAPIDFRKSKLKKLSLFVHKYDRSFFWQQVELLIPSTLETLTLYGNHIRLSLCQQFESWTKRKIVRLESSTFGIEDPCWNRNTAKLIRHMIYPVQMENWQFSLEQRSTEDFINRDPWNRIVFLRRRADQNRNRADGNEAVQDNNDMNVDNEELTTPPSSPSPRVSPN